MSITAQKRRKPSKPYPSFPLAPHNNGQWCKKVRGKIYFSAYGKAPLPPLGTISVLPKTFTRDDNHVRQPYPPKVLLSRNCATDISHTNSRRPEPARSRLAGSRTVEGWFHPLHGLSGLIDSLATLRPLIFSNTGKNSFAEVLLVPFPKRFYDFFRA